MTTNALSLGIRSIGISSPRISGSGLSFVINPYVFEDAPIDTPVCTLSVAGVGGTPLYGLIDDAGGKFYLDGDTVKVAEALDYETATSHSLTASVSGVIPPLSNITFTVHVRNILETGINLTGNSVLEASVLGTPVGTFSVVGAVGVPVFTLTDDAGGRFVLDGNVLEVAGDLDYDVSTSHNITVSVTGIEPAFADTTFTISVINVVEEGIVLSGTTVVETVAIGTTVGTLSVFGGSGIYTFTITADPDNKFTIVGSALQTDAALDFEADASHAVTIQADNGAGSILSQTFNITVLDVDETVGPGVVSYSPADNATEVSILSALIIIFDETIVLNSGNITLKKTSDSSTIEAWNVATEVGSTAGKVEIVASVQLRMHLTANLALNTGYHVVWDAGVVKNLADEPIGVNSSATTWNFTTQAAAAAAGWDILLTTGDSQKQFGEGLDVALDVADADISSLGFTAPNNNVVISSQEPLDYATWGIAGAIYIGHDAHFMIDHYKQFGHLLSPRKGMICTNSLGGSSVFTSWGAVGGTPGNPTADPGGMLDVSGDRLDVVLALTGTNVVKAVIESGDPNAYVAYGITHVPDVIRDFRVQYNRKIQWLRNTVGPTVPILVGRNAPPLIDNYGANGVCFDRIITSIAANFPYTYYVDSRDPTDLGTYDGIHYTAEAQRIYAQRCYPAYQLALANTKRVVRWDTDCWYAADGFSSGFTITNDGFDIAGDVTGAWKTARATGPLRSGKAYLEVEVAGGAVGPNYGFIGFCNAGFDMRIGTILGSGSAGGAGNMSAGVYAGSSAGQAVYGYTQVWAGDVSVVVDDRLMFAVDMTSGKAWIGKNGVWYNSGNPVAGTGEWLSGIVDPIHVAVCIYSLTTSKWRLRPRTEDFVYTIPTDFEPWDEADYIPPEPTEGGPTVGDGLLLQTGTDFLKLQDDFYLVLE